MHGSRTGGRTRQRRAARARRLALRLALLAATALFGLSLAPGVSSAAGGRTSENAWVVPLLDCVVRHDDGSFTAVWGYWNPTGSTITIPQGASNRFQSLTHAAAPTSFQPGVQHGVFSVTVAKGDSPSWDLDGTRVTFSAATAQSCSAPTPLPATGNGTGAAIALLVAGIVGAGLYRTAVARGAPAPAPARAGRRWPRRRSQTPLLPDS
jgi:hypothetical protein